MYEVSKDYGKIAFRPESLSFHDYVRKSCWRQTPNVHLISDYWPARFSAVYEGVRTSTGLHHNRTFPSGGSDFSSFQNTFTHNISWV